MTPPLVIVLNGVIVAVTDNTPRILTVKHPDHSLLEPEEVGLGEGAQPDALPFVLSIPLRTARSSWACEAGYGSKPESSWGTSNNCTLSGTAIATRKSVKGDRGSFPSLIWPW